MPSPFPQPFFVMYAKAFSREVGKAINSNLPTLIPRLSQFSPYRVKPFLDRVDEALQRATKSLVGNPSLEEALELYSEIKALEVGRYRMEMTSYVYEASLQFLAYEREAFVGRIPFMIGSYEGRKWVVLLSVEGVKGAERAVRRWGRNLKRLLNALEDRGYSVYMADPSKNYLASLMGRGKFPRGVYENLFDISKARWTLAQGSLKHGYYTTIYSVVPPIAEELKWLQPTYVKSFLLTCISPSTPLLELILTKATHTLFYSVLPPYTFLSISPLKHPTKKRPEGTREEATEREEKVNQGS